MKNSIKNKLLKYFGRPDLEEYMSVMYEDENNNFVPYPFMDWVNITKGIVEKIIVKPLYYINYIISSIICKILSFPFNIYLKYWQWKHNYHLCSDPEYFARLSEDREKFWRELLDMQSDCKL